MLKISIEFVLDKDFPGELGSLNKMNQLLREGSLLTYASEPGNVFALEVIDLKGYTPTKEESE